MSTFYRSARTFVVRPVVRALFNPWVKGRAHVPETGGAILASNHLSVSDSVFMPASLDRQVHFLAKMEYFTGTGLKGWITRKFFVAINQLPMDRSGGAASLRSLQAGLEALQEGNLLGIYPEGTRSPDGRLHRGKIGVAKLALAADVPVVPIAMIGTDKVQPIGQSLPRPGRVGVIFGEPLTFSHLKDRKDEIAVLRQVTDEIMEAIRRLSGQEYVDVYAADVKSGHVQAPPRAART
ncbi:lysophospholipid acyltransferase family protein [Micrococcus lylae]|uniref:lysophospholipid acyltransferase family protein n=1 Tax=Micrococcus lylae TaxID=1273 RepID=UPI0021A692A4|nr:lysophospholipid acyltransferase family protein [Micrococcus lylae]MCT2007371.1 1-acyl-sn-glycerol-3-phosphate acyltransferase [Micrococcus lylae]MCT2071202.1 1-acyl-sn-glycerol-3-phosphate acyltransferase [Micrococcus lylae]